MQQLRTMAVGHVEQDSTDRKLIVRGLPRFVTDTMLFQALQLNQHIVSLHIFKRFHHEDLDQTGVVRQKRDNLIFLNRRLGLI
jgi:hypothetical protein